MNYKMIVTDLDDTLVLPDGHISQRTLDAFKKASEQGIFVVLASGRAESGIFPVAKQLDLSCETGYILSYNGGKIFKYGESKPRYELGVNFEQIKLLYKLGMENGVDVLTYSDTEILVTKTSEYSDLESLLANMPIRQTDDFLEQVPKNVGKVMFLAEPTHLAKVKEKLAPILEQDMYGAISKPFFLEYTNKNVNKGKSLHELAKITGVDVKEMIACGDSYNDLTMIEEAGLGVAMANASGIIKETADIVSKSCKEDGVANIIEKILL